MLISLYDPIRICNFNLFYYIYDLIRLVKLVYAMYIYGSEIHLVELVYRFYLRRCDGSEALLTGRVPDLQFHLLPVYLETSNFKVDADRRDVGAWST